MAYTRNLAVSSSNRVVLSGSNVQVTGSLFGTAISGTTAQFTTVTSSLGSVTVPSYTFSGDTNTGIYSPAADTIAFTTAGTEGLRISSNNAVTASGDMMVNGGDLDSTVATFNLLNSPTTVNAFNNSTVINISNNTAISTDLRVYSANNAAAVLYSNSSSIYDGHELGRFSVVAPITASSATLGSRGVVAVERDGLDGAGKITLNVGVGNSASTRTKVLQATKDGILLRDGLIIGSLTGTITQGSGDLLVYGQTLNALGSVSAPAYSFISDTNTGMFQPASNTIAFSLAGIEAVRFGSSTNRISITSSGNDSLSSIRLLNTYTIPGYWDISVPGTGKTLAFSYNNTQKGYISNAVDVANIDFTGQHRNVMQDLTQSLEDIIGLIVVSTGEYESLSNNSIRKQDKTK